MSYTFKAFYFLGGERGRLFVIILECEHEKFTWNIFPDITFFNFLVISCLGRVYIRGEDLFLISKREKKKRNL